MTTRQVVHAVRSSAFAGVERYVSDVCNELVRRGWSVDVLGGDPVDMRRVLDTRIRFRPAVGTSELIRGLRRIGPSPLIHAHMTAAETAAVLASTFSDCRIVSTRHFARRRGSSPMARVGSRIIERGIDREIAISQFVSKALGGGHTVLLNGVPPEPQSRGGRNILVMQRLEPEKDTETAVKAFARSGLADDGWVLQIAGRGSQLEQLKSLAARESVHASTQFLGFVRDPAALRSDAGIFLASAPAEPFGLSVVEAMAAGLPVVAAAGGGHLETLAEAGLFFPSGNAAAAGSALRALGSSLTARQAAGDLSISRHRHFLTLDAHVDRLEEIYAEVLG